MKTYPLIEVFYSIKGEGLWTGTPMLFLRFAGCNQSCTFCDTPSAKQMDLSHEQILKELNNLSRDCHRIVITGGEPNIHDLRSLFNFLHDFGFDLHMETNGQWTEYIQHNIEGIDFLTISPKSIDRLSQAAFDRCDEVKYPYPQDEENIWKVEKMFQLNDPKRWILPIAEAYQNGIGRNAIIPANVASAIEFCKNHPEFALCLQVHKWLQIP